MAKLRKRDTRKLLKALSDTSNPFRWRTPSQCVGHYAEQIAPKNDKIASIGFILGLNYEKAIYLYQARNANGTLLIPDSAWQGFTDNDGTLQRQTAIQYIQSLLDAA